LPIKMNCHAKVEYDAGPGVPPIHAIIIAPAGGRHWVGITAASRGPCSAGHGDDDCLSFGDFMTDNVRHQPGDKIAGYVLEDQIGAGGMAVVFRARDERLGRHVALKLLAPGLAAADGFRQRFIRESRAAAAVEHPNIIPIYEAGEAAGVLFIAMRYVQGGDVRALIDRGGPLPAARACTIVGQIAAALDAAHGHGLVHRDIKPGNILLDASAGSKQGPGPGPAGPSGHVYLSDFGISKQPTGASGLTMAGQFVGTLDYIAPEQIEGHDLDGRADLYSLGCAAYELLSGWPPFRPAQGLALIRAHLSQRPPALTAQRPDLPAAIDWVLARAMAKSPDERYLTCAEFAADLGRSLGLVPGSPGPPKGRKVDAVTQQAPYRGARPGFAHDRSYPATAPAGPPAPRPRSAGLVAGAIVAGLAVVTAGAVAAVLLARGPGRSLSTAGSGAPGLADVSSQNAQAQNLNNLLSSGAGSTPQLEAAIGKIDDCTDMADSIIALTRIRDQRNGEYLKAQDLSVSQLPQGISLKSDLTQALRYSLLADNDYLDWADEENLDGCQTGTEPGQPESSDNTAHDNSQASAFKGNFLPLWRPIATHHGFAWPPSI
jgi:serine/threonine protein kinase